MRPIYETAHDKSNERDVANQLAKAWRCEVLKLPDRFGIGFVGVRLRCRVVSWIDIATTKDFDAAKVDRMAEVSRLTGLPLILVAACTDGIWHARIDSDQRSGFKRLSD